MTTPTERGGRSVLFYRLLSALQIGQKDALLKEQHDEVRAIFKALEKGNGHAKELLNKLADSLAGHMVIE